MKNKKCWLIVPNDQTDVSLGNRENRHLKNQVATSSAKPTITHEHEANPPPHPHCLPWPPFPSIARLLVWGYFSYRTVRTWNSLGRSCHQSLFVPTGHSLLKGEHITAMFKGWHSSAFCKHSYAVRERNWGFYLIFQELWLVGNYSLAWNKHMFQTLEI